ncbi:hypothetical protein ACFL10_00880 [Patescibacteria group bacterium]
MDNTQTPNPQANMPEQKPAEIPVAPQAVQPEVQAQPEPPKKKKKFLGTAILSLAIVFVGGIAGTWYYFQNLSSGIEAPPSLQMGASKFQGQSIGDQLGALVYDADDVAAPGANWAKLPAGVNHVYAEVDVTPKDVADNLLKPVDGLRIFLADYDGEFYLYPTKGPYLAEDITDGDAYTIPAGKAFSILASEPFEIDSNVLKDSSTSASQSHVSDFAGEAAGWYMLALRSADDITALQDQVQVFSVWPQVAQNEFARMEDLSAPDLSAGYSLAWFRLGAPVAELIEPPTTAVCGDGVVEGTEECDGGTDCEADCTLTPTPAAPAPDPVCGDGNVDTAEGEECDDGNTVDGDGCEADCTLPPAPAAPECGDGNVDAGEECDDGNMNSDTGVCSTSCSLSSETADPTITATLVEQLNGVYYAGFGNEPEPESIMLAFELDASEDSALTAINTTWQGCVSPGDNNYHANLFVSDGTFDTLVAPDLDYDGNFTGDEFSPTYNFTGVQLFKIKGNTGNCVLDTVTPDMVTTTLDSVEWVANSQNYTAQFTGISAQLIYDQVVAAPVCGNNIVEGAEVCDKTDLDNKTCADIDPDKPEGALRCKDSCGGFDNSQCYASTLSEQATQKDYLVVTTTQTGLPHVRIYNGFSNGVPGEEIYGNFQKPSTLDPVLIFQPDAANPVSEFELTYSGCLLDDFNKPVSVPTLYTETGFLSTPRGPAIAKDKNRDGIFTDNDPDYDKEFNVSPAGIDANNRYVLVLDTTIACSDNTDPGSSSDTGAVGFANATPAVESFSTMIFGEGVVAN